MAKFISYDEVAKASESQGRRDPTKILTIAISHVEYETEQRFDSIFIVHVLEHLIDPVTVLKRAGELLAPGGRLFLIVPNGAAASRQIAVKMQILPTLASLSEADVKAAEVSP